jgi:type I restriction-modification system DNA methylase subunit
MQDEARKKIKDLVAKYEAEKAAGKITKYSEEETKRGFIEPLFEALGWNFSSKEEITLEEQISGDRVDYGFYLNSRIKFYLEAKPLKADLHREDYAKQSIKYSWNKGVTWAVLTDFESLIVFNALSPEKSLAGKRYFEIPYNEFLERFDQLWLLSKEAFLSDSLDKEAEKHGKKIQKVSVTEKLAEDLNYCRKELTEAFRTWNKDVPEHLVDEGVQKFLDRLIFIRVAEDRKIEPPTLIPLLHQYKSSGETGKTSPYQAMIDKFRELDKIYNSNLFSEHPFEKWEEFSGATEKVINKLYGDKDYFEYDFSAIPADVLGAVYENYLGYRLEQTKNKLFDQDLDLAKSHKKRKEQGIYYTPKFIVDYIVKNALGPILDKCKSVNDLQKIKILDPACGSGSFLVAAMNFLIKKYEEFCAKPDGFLKIQILQSNIYGVDLDEQAVELARLNLLLNTFDSQTKLPKLGGNIKNGNSLISGTDEELEKFFGKNYRDKKPFNWQEQFPEVFKQGGFDVIIGNPPYGAELSKEDQSFFKDKYDIGSTDTAILFIKKSLTELKKEGFLGFIIPKAFTFASNYKKIRQLVWDDLKIIIDGSKVWKEVKLEQVVIIVEKDVGHKIYQSGIAKDEQISILGKIDKKTAKEFGFFLNGVSDKEIIVAQKMLKNYLMMKDVATNQRGAMLQKEVGEAGELEVLGGASISRMGIGEIKGKIDKEKVSDDKAFMKSNSVLVQNIVAHIENPVDHIKIISAISDDKNYIILDTINQLTLDKRYSNYFIWSLLNSELVNWYVYRFIYGKAIRTMHFDNFVTDRLPIPKVSLRDQEGLIKLAKLLWELYKKIEGSVENSNEYQKIKDEIAQTDKKIDQEVYKLYGLTEEEIKMVERQIN